MSSCTTVVVALLTASLASCGGSDTRGRVAESLMTVDDLSGEWSVNLGSDDMQLPESGEITEEQREFLPTMDLCDAASQDSKDAVDALKWEAFRQFDMSVDDPVDVPRDREGRIVFVQEFLMSGNPDELSEVLKDLSDGLDACVGAIPAGEEGPGTLVRFEPVAVGDERTGALYTIEEAGGAGTWYVYEVIARKGDVLTSLSVVEVVLGEIDPLIDQQMVDDITATAVEKIG